MGFIERLSSITSESEGSKAFIHAWGALARLVQYQQKTPAQARAILVAQMPELTGAEKAIIIGWFNDIPTEAVGTGVLPAPLLDAAATLVEKEWITRAECKAIYDATTATPRS